MDDFEIEEIYKDEEKYVGLGSEKRTHEKNVNYVAISPDGSIVATFNPYGSSISITKVATNDKANIRFNINTFKNSVNILGWSLAISDIIDTESDTFLVAISCVTDKDLISAEEIELGKFLKFLKWVKFFIKKFKKQLPFWDSQLILILLIILYYVIFTFTLPVAQNNFIEPFFYLLFIIIPIYILFSYEYTHTRKILVTDDKQFRLSCGKGMIKLYTSSFNNNDDNDDNTKSVDYYHLGGAVTFLKNSKNSAKNSATLICMNCIKIQKINIRLRSISITKEGTYLLPENLFEKLESFKNAECKWNYLLKSRFQEFLMIDTRKNDRVQSIEIYDINNLKLVNVFYRHREEDFLISNNDEPGIFAISTDSRLFAYSYYGNNVITLYLMESGLEIISKKVDNIYKIKFLEFIEKDKKLFIIEEDKGGDVKFHVWLISGCLNDYLSISKDDIVLSDSNIPTLSKHDVYYNISKANGKVVFHHEDQFKVLNETTIKRSGISFGENTQTDEHKVMSRDLEPWNGSGDNTMIVRVSNDKNFLLIIGQNSIQIWKSKYQSFNNFRDFKNFENSNLVYILISDKIKSEVETKFQIDDDMVTVVTHACKSLVYLYKHKSDNFNEKHQRFVSGITNIIKDFIKRYPDKWKLMEVQHPLMSYLIYSRSFSLIKYILFGVNGQINGKLHKPQNKYVSYPYNYLELCDDLELKGENSNPANDLELALEFCQERDAVMLAYLLEYYSENSMTHIGWMINVTKILPRLSELSNHDYYYGNYMDLLLYKPCFGKMKYNFPIKRFRELSVYEETVKVYVPLTKLRSKNSKDVFIYNKISEDISPDFYMVPLRDFTTHDITHDDAKIEENPKKGILHLLRKTLFPPGYKNLKDEKLSPFLQIKKNEKTFFSIPAIEATINSRWYQVMAYWIRPLSLHAMFLILYTTLPQYHIFDIMHLIFNSIGTGIFYYIGIYLSIFILKLEYNEKYPSLFKLFYICCILLGMFTFLLVSPLFTINTNIDTASLYATVDLLLWSILSISPSDKTYAITVDNGTISHDLNLTVSSQDNPLNTIWDAILSMYYLGTNNLYDYSDDLSFVLFVFLANVILVLALLNMIIALMNDTFGKAKNEGNLGLLMFRKELIDDFERLDIPFNNLKLDDTPYICYLNEPELMEKWEEKSKELGKTKLYSWFRERGDKENITYDGVNITSWYELISSNENQTPNHMTLWF
ncbi:hypothetical protein RclHR1_03390008 [Rhizophagus clarus]|uniref:Ion transport domain-containing protein n=1 Tax=Rhizophagus clarus TaxID=94130 RepID=A0A2Z6RDG5_9GLOM|nr:hypothetical protein RclHR1_03390008 [Rhizophagus clarus]